MFIRRVHLISHWLGGMLAACGKISAYGNLYLASANV